MIRPLKFTYCEKEIVMDRHEELQDHNTFEAGVVITMQRVDDEDIVVRARLASSDNHGERKLSPLTLWKGIMLTKMDPNDIDRMARYLASDAPGSGYKSFLNTITKIGGEEIAR